LQLAAFFFLLQIRIILKCLISDPLNSLIGRISTMDQGSVVVIPVLQFAYHIWSQVQVSFLASILIYYLDQGSVLIVHCTKTADAVW